MAKGKEIDIKLNSLYSSPGELDKIVDRILKDRGVESYLTFSAYKHANEDTYFDSPILAPDIESLTPVFQGLVGLAYGGRGSTVLIDPTWADIIAAISSFTDGDHVFFEGFYSEGNCKDKVLPSCYKGKKIPSVRICLGS